MGNNLESSEQEQPIDNQESQYVMRTRSADDEAPEPLEENNSETNEGENINTDTEDQNSKEGTPENNDIQALKQQMDMLQKQVASSQSFIGKQSSEIGRLRKELKSKSSEAVDPKKFINDFVENPSKAIEAEIQRREEAKAEEAETQHHHYQNNLNMVLSVVPNIDALIPAMLEELKTDGVENPSVEMIKSSISVEPHLVLNYAKRAAYKQQLSQSEQKGKQFIEKVANGSKKSPTVQGKSLTSSTQKPVSTRDLRNMSDEDLNKLYSSMTRK